MHRFRLLLCATLLLGASGLRAEPRPAPRQAPELPPTMEWLNVPRAFTLADLRGRYGVLVFWTSSSSISVNALRAVSTLEHLSPAPVVIGVHTGRLPREQDLGFVRSTVERLSFSFPVIHDPSRAIWGLYGSTAWPSLSVIDPKGALVLQVAGYDGVTKVTSALTTLSKKVPASGAITPLPRVASSPLPPEESVLRFPTRVVADEVTGRLFIADTGHHRIVVTDLSGRVLDRIGGGSAGSADGDFGSSTFNSPHGLALKDSYLFVADTGNHLVRRVDLSTRTVSTILGSGSSKPFDSSGTGPRDHAIVSPYDLLVRGDSLLISSGATHQIWESNLSASSLSPILGSGREGRVDGTGLRSAFGEPRGLASDGSMLFVADSSTSALRAVDMSGPKSIRTLIGRTRGAGDVEGPIRGAALQSPTGVVAFAGGVLVSDTLNGKIKMIAPDFATVTTVAGELDGPEGMSVAGGKLYVAVAGQHAVKRMDLATRVMEDFSVRQNDSASGSKDLLRPNLAKESRSLLDVSREGPLTVVFSMQFADGYELNREAPSDVVVTPEGGVPVALQIRDVPQRVTVNAPAESTRLTLEATVYFCRSDKSGICEIKSYEIIQPIQRGGTGSVVNIPAAFAPPQR